VKTDQNLAFTPASELRELIASKQLSPVELTEMYLRRIEEMNPTLNAFLTITAEQAMETARKAEAAVVRGDALGPLHGIPTSIKDLVPTKGVRTTRGSLTLKDWIPDEDDAVVDRIKGAGAIILGKTNTPEFGLSGTTENRLGDDCRNPWNPERVSGGSSGGAAASLAAGLNPIAQGSDGGGSIRIPASFCGVYGIKGTQGRVPRKYSTQQGHLPINFSQIGPMSRTVLDSAIFMNVMAGPHPQDPGSALGEPPDYTAELSKGVKGLRIGWSPDFGSAAVDPEVLQATQKAAEVFQELGANVEPAGLEIDISALQRLYVTITNVSHYMAYGWALEEHPEMLMDYVHSNIKNGKAVTGAQYAMATSELAQHRSKVAAYFDDFDLLLTPTLAVPAFPCGQRPVVIGGKDVSSKGHYPFTFAFNMSGNPAASVPCGFSSDGMPIGLHIVGRRLDEVTVLQASAAFEQARPWAQHRPAVS
jgi:aspartyl-tRNA(Asn)/glutamyl-tRNA(Gln) amidotransferase subunit A